MLMLTGHHPPLVQGPNPGRDPSQGLLSVIREGGGLDLSLLDHATQEIIGPDHH